MWSLSITSQRLLAVDFSPSCVIKNWEKLILTIGPANTSAVASAKSALVTLYRNRFSRSMKLDVRVSGRAFSIDQPERQLSIPLDDQRLDYVFEVLPLQHGQWELLLEITQGTMKIKKFLIKVEVKQRGSPNIHTISED